MLLSLSIQLFHPYYRSDEIKRYFNMVPDIEFNVNEKRKTPKGKILDSIHDRTYLCYQIIKSEEIINLEDSIRDVNYLFESKIKEVSFLSQFNRTGGEIDYYITIYIDKYFAFVLKDDILRKCAELYVCLGFETFIV